MLPPRTLLLGALLLPGITAAVRAQHEGVTPTPPAAKIDFARSVRPILAQHCYTCHGPDDKQRKGDLRLDQKEHAFAPRDNGPAFVANDPEHSEALLRILSSDPDQRMPPPEAGDALPPAAIATLRAWIEAGAPWSEHWAFVPPKRPTPPTVTDTAWPLHDVDRFVLARLEREGLRPSAPTSREAWLRRVTFDLIGLPPTLAELDAFVKDQTPEAHAKVVDRLLADPRYGERMATDWLDLARYADSSGYQRDTPRIAWKWRDWVIDAFNTDMPFDRFTIEQLAGDLLPNPTLSQRIATGFNRNHPVNTEAGEELDEYRSAYVIDRVHTTATTWLGLSLGCAQCHDHKYDPVSQRDFYRFYDFFNHVKEKDSGFGRNPKPAIIAPGPEDEPRVADLQRRIKTLKRRLDRPDPLADAAQIDWERATRARIGAPLQWTTLTPTERMAKHGSRLVPQDDGSIVANGPLPARDVYELVFVPGKRTIHALRLEVLPDPSLPHGASGRADDGRFILTKFEARLASVADSTDPPPMPFVVAQADVEQDGDEDEHYLTAINPGSIASALGGESFGGFSFGGWSIAGDERKQPRDAVLIPLEPLVCNETTILRITMAQGSSNKFKSLIGRFRISSSDEPRVRTLLVPLQPTHWRTLGPFPAADVGAAVATAFAPEADLKDAQWKKKYDAPVLPPEQKPSAKAAGKDKAPPAEAKDKAEPAAKPAEPAPMAAGAAEDKGEPEAADADGADEASDKAPKKPKAARLAWQERTEWREGGSQSLPIQGKAAAWYVARKITCASARTMLLELDSKDVVKVWLNGNVVTEYELPGEPLAKPAAADKAKGEMFDFDEAAFFGKGGRSVSRDARRLRIGLRAGDNHLVLKLVGKGADKGAAPKGGGKPGPADIAALFAMGEVEAVGAALEGLDEMPPMQGPPGRSNVAFAATMRAEGDDVLDYATMQALRALPPTDDPALAEATATGKAADALDLDESKPKTPQARQVRSLRRWFRTRIDIAGRVLFEELERLERERQQLEAKLPSALVMEELKTPRETHLFVRGDYRKKGEKVTAGTPAVLPPMAADLPKNRLGLARWLVQPDHPLTARVAVNRAWQQVFGNGLVRTADDFGIRGAPPSHPELLDWLATEFVRLQWSQKQLHRLLVLSATYRQSATVSAELLAKDPENVLLTRGPANRLTAEMLRDQALAVSGLLVQKVGGPSVKPFQPSGLWKEMLGGSDWKNDQGDDVHRRALYTYWKRGVPYPMATIFDAAKRETCTVTRTRTVTPLQALVTMNDPTFVEAGKAFGLRMRKDGGKDDAARLQFGFRSVTSRAPDERELAILQALLADQRAHFAKHPDAAKKVLGIVEPKGKDKGKPKAKDAGDAKDAPKEGAAVAAPPIVKPEQQAAAAAAANAPAATPPAAPAQAAAATNAEPAAPAANAALPTSSSNRFDAAKDPAEAAAWAQIGCTLWNLEAAIRRG